MLLRISLTALTLILGSVLAQPAASPAEFEVAVVQPTPPSSARLGIALRVVIQGGPGTEQPGTITYRNLTIRDYVGFAYGVKGFQIRGPALIDNQRYDILAKMAPDTTKEQFRVMLQRLLAARFKLTLRRETRNAETYALAVSKRGFHHSQDQPNTLVGTGAGSDGRNRDTGTVPGAIPTVSIRMDATRIAVRERTMEWLADMLSNQLKGPVVDATGLTGTYTFVLEFARSHEIESGAIPSLPAALQEVGLRLERRKAPLETLVIVHVEKTPIRD
jgi:uncharacterized protein (TIGR03435 family)